MRWWKLRRWASLGPDGLAMLGLANAVVLLTGGLSLAWCFGRVYRTARRAPVTADNAGMCVVLGARLDDDGPSPDFRLRLERARRLAGGGVILVLGGATRAGAASEAEAGRAWLTARGVDAGAVLTETGSRDTLENLRAARDILARLGPGPPVLVSSRSHLARSGMLAAGLGIPHLLCAAEDTLARDPPTILRMIYEAYLINWYVVGRSWARWTRNERMLMRIS